ncbi:MAG: DsrE family protein [Campylobacterota bacterium]|nr:DsrE family protein [Campylobacterota bacterium]
MKKTLSKLILAAVIAAPFTINASDDRQDLLAVITSGDSMTQFMGLVLATQANKQGADVDVLFCSKAADLVIKGAKEVTFKPKGISPNKLLQGLIKSGANVGVCPPYLPNNAKTKADLIDGVKVAKPPKIAAKMLKEYTQVITY